MPIGTSASSASINCATTGTPEIEAFLTHLASHEQVSASTQNQALAALLFLYREVLGIPLGDLHALLAKKTTYVQPYLTHDEYLRILAHLDGASYLVACFLYGGGLRPLEALRLRIQDLDLENSLITIRDTKPNRDRITFLPDDEQFRQRLRAHLERVRCPQPALTKGGTPTPRSPSPCRRPWPANIPGPKHPGNGNMSSPHVTSP